MKTCFVLVLLLSAVVLPGQDKHDYVWLLGYPPNSEQDSLGGTLLDFNARPPAAIFFETPYGLGQSAAVCDHDGNLAFYTNGCDIRNRYHQQMQNGEGINAGQMQGFYCFDGNGTYPNHQGVLALPYPGLEGRYALFHLRMDDFAFSIDQLMYSVIDAEADAGHGAVLQKNVLLLQTSLADQLTGVRHANGRDWWIVVPQQLGNRYYIFLFSPEGVVGPWMQNIGHSWAIASRRGQACFSPDGSKYVRTDPYNGIQLFDFDRCAGVLSNHVAVGLLPHHFGYEWHGLSISPNSRFLYMSYPTLLLQYDLHAANIAASVRYIALYDGSFSPQRTNFYQHTLGPNGKIYITAHNSVNCLHVIHRPDELGVACDFEQRGLRLPSQHALAAPNIPHFRLWGEAGSPCDTLGLTGPVAAPEERRPPFDIRLFPNPAGEQAILLLEGAPPGPAWMGLYNAMGQLVRQASWPQAGRHEISLAGLPAGVYYAQIATADGQRRVLPLAKR
jgi:hypothetical protein